MMTPSTVAPGVQGSAPQDFANPASVPLAEPGFEAQLSLALSGQPVPAEETADEGSGDPIPLVTAETGLQNLPPVLAWLPNPAANFSTPVAPGPIGSQTLDAVDLTGAVPATAATSAPFPIDPQTAAASAPSLPTGAAPAADHPRPLEPTSAATPAQGQPVSSGPADPLANAARTPAEQALQTQQASAAQGTDTPATGPTGTSGQPTASQTAQTLAEATQGAAAAAAQQQLRSDDASARQASAVLQTAQSELATQAAVNASDAKAAKAAAQPQAQPSLPAAIASPTHQAAPTEGSTVQAPQTLQQDISPAQAALPATPTSAPVIVAASAQAAEKTIAQNGTVGPAETVVPTGPQSRTDIAAEPSEPLEAVRHSGPRLGIEDGPESGLLMPKALGSEPVAVSTAGGTPSVEVGSTADAPGSLLGSNGSNPTPSVPGAAPSTSVTAPTTPTVDVSLPIKPHLVSLEGGAVQVEILRMARDGGGQITLELTPPDQGRYRLDLRIDDLGQATLVVDGASESTRTRLEMGESALREQFSQLGLQLNLQLRSSQGEHHHDTDLATAAPAAHESDAQSSANLDVPGRRSTALDLDRGLVRLYA